MAEWTKLLALKGLHHEVSSEIYLLSLQIYAEDQGVRQDCASIVEASTFLAKESQKTTHNGPRRCLHTVRYTGQGTFVKILLPT